MSFSPSAGLRCALAALALLIGAPPALAADPFPAKPVTLIVNFPAGGVTDGTFRRMATRFKTLTGQPLILDNRPGRGVASAVLANARPDGYTLGVLGRTQLSLYWQLNGRLPYHPVDDFTWIANVTSSYFGLYVPASAPYHTVKDLVAAAKAAPGSIRYGTAFGNGGLTHVPMDDFARAAGIDMLHVPFKGDTDAIMLLRQGGIDMIVAGGTAMPMVDSGHFRLLAWMSPSRNARMPQVPMLRELGYPVEAVAPVGVGGPKGMDPAHVAYYERIFQQLLDDKEVREYLDLNYQRMDFMDSKAFTAWARRQLPIEQEIVKRFNLANDGK